MNVQNKLSVGYLTLFTTKPEKMDDWEIAMAIREHARFSALGAAYCRWLLYYLIDENIFPRCVDALSVIKKTVNIASEYYDGEGEWRGGDYDRSQIKVWYKACEKRDEENINKMFSHLVA